MGRRLTDEYELMPADELAALRKEVEILKSNPFGDSKHGKTLLEAIEQLTVGVNRLVKIFSDAETEILNEHEKVKSVDEQLHELQDENRKIASGIVTVAQLLKNQEDGSTRMPQASPPTQYAVGPYAVGSSWQQEPARAPQQPPLPAPPMQEQQEELAAPQIDITPPDTKGMFSRHQPAPPPTDPWQPRTVAPPRPMAPSQQLVDSKAQPLPMPPPPPPPKKGQGQFL